MPDEDHIAHAGTRGSPTEGVRPFGWAQPRPLRARKPGEPSCVACSLARSENGLLAGQGLATNNTPTWPRRPAAAQARAACARRRPSSVSDNGGDISPTSRSHVVGSRSLPGLERPRCDGARDQGPAGRASVWRGRPTRARPGQKRLVDHDRPRASRARRRAADWTQTRSLAKDEAVRGGARGVGFLAAVLATVEALRRHRAAAFHEDPRMLRALRDFRRGQRRTR